MKVNEIISKYKLSPNSYYSKSPYKKKATEKDEERYRQFCEKWIPYTEDGWYGPQGLGHPTPIKIYDALDEFLQYLVDKNPNMQIHQIKWKFGSLRLYIAGLNEESQQEVLKFCDVCADKFLVY